MATANDTTTATQLDRHARNYRFGWTSSIYTPPGENHWRFADFGPSTPPLGASGIIREYQRVRQSMGTTYWACAIWQGDRKIAEGAEVRELIREYTYAEEERSYRNWQRGGRR